MNLLERQIQRELTKMDHRLWLDVVWSPFGYTYYVVRQPGENGPPLTVVDWREGNYPLPLSMDLLDQVRRQEGDLAEAVRTATVNNAARKELARQEREKIQDEIISDWQKASKGLAKHRTEF